MSNLYVVLYINTDDSEHSEVLGVYTNKNGAVAELLERANYREIDGKLTQYMKPCDEYESFQALRDKVCRDMELKDVDIYRIQELPCLSGKRDCEKLLSKNLKKGADPSSAGQRRNTAINQESLEKYIDSLLADKDTNIKLLPDFVERKIYSNVFSILLRLMDDTLENTSISFLGHRIVFDVVNSGSEDGTHSS